MNRLLSKERTVPFSRTVPYSKQFLIQNEVLRVCVYNYIYTTKINTREWAAHTFELAASYELLIQKP